MAFFVKCPITIKQKLEVLLCDAKNYHKDVTPIIINANRLFSVYEFTGENECIKMLLISKSGIAKINQLCEKIDKLTDIYTTLLRYILTKTKDSMHDDKIRIIKNLVKALAYHYYTYRNQSLYSNQNEMTQSCVCIFCPLQLITYRSLNHILNEMRRDSASCILKDCIPLNEIKL